ncbi:MAG: bifunctional UDP-N-acetylmuramoyl-tripeptide:D-alanyl-D-alanine ligase/alanine racemase [Dysgonamonadaceae bacterium]|nr:bifunctional UDP-N-acetylmuramoyl-tripeptide:D-alanyl-D-alanine ligase/alanine racemase [Dysgonamonadaceae bacterium]
MKYTVNQISKIISAKGIIRNHSTINYLLTDSRSLSHPEETLFFALQTILNDGHKYIPNLYRAGVRNFIIQHYIPELEKLTEANFLLVDNSLTALQQLAAFHRAQFDIPIVGITGSNGKTIVKEWLYQLLNNDFNIVRSPRSYNSQIGVPLSVWQLDGKTELGIFEAGISQVSEMQQLENIIKPTIGILTNIGDAHQENFTSLKEKCLQKLELFQNSQLLIYDADNEIIEDAINTSDYSFEKFGWSQKNPNAPLFIKQIKKEKDYTSIDFVFDEKENSITIPFDDDASIENAIHCLAIVLCLTLGVVSDVAALSFGVVSDYVAAKSKSPDLQIFRNLEPVAMRLDVKKGINHCILINDTYNSDINSLHIALDFMLRRSVDNKMKSVLILSDILQSGVPNDIFYAKVAELIKKKQIQHIIGIGNNLSKQADKFDVEKEFYSTTESFLQSGKIRQFDNSIILIKGSRSFAFEKITEQLEEKIHETMLEVDLDAIIHNFKYFRSKLKSETKIICMVKAFGYGVGSYELAKTLQDQGCDYLAVAVADEGDELRKEGISMPIMVMNPETNSFNTLFDNHLEPEIYSFRILKTMLKEAEKRGITQYPVHIKLDTGMHRLGFEKNDMQELIQILNNQSCLKVRSAFSHLAGSDSLLHDEYTMQQFALFNSLAAELEVALSYPIMKHALNSAGIERFSQFQSDMVRLGIGLYGISAVDKHALQNVATLKTIILQIKDRKKDETIGYGRNGILSRDSRIACLPIGYADGLDRKLSNKGSVFIDGKRCPIIGNICMDLCMVDVTDTNAQEGDTAIIFGKEITIEEVANQLDTIPYEILTSISPRVKRVYFKE